MSRIGKKPIPIPSGVKVIMKPGCVEVSSSKGKVVENIHPNITVDLDQEKNELTVNRPDDSKENKALHGLFRSLLANAVHGVSQGFEKKLDIVGTGYNAKLKGNILELQIGFCLPKQVAIPEGIQVEVPSPTKIAIKGCNKQQVGQFAANVRKIRPPEPYKGKGIRYENEVIIRKAGKSFGSG
ncbi:50S ribosomal protein L6 [Candidatus Uabimicrobium amorphum]|uniref:Large ribosomal subunit protein uL6 n=1 Tax=Uabimicrobium amorphum TaxID=2596890 RepID=A0A5S9F5I2_UABAM|nr:50S ribosomal protein L6 [Candidatus Uabimicrobium amorphum]BBM85594.1 50S ribosomal protein L6 [Candidatus Uabimicrobium amorphum]